MDLLIISKIGGGVAVASSTLASVYSSMPKELALPVNTLITGLVALLLRWVEIKAFKKRERKKIKAEIEHEEFLKRA